MNSTKHSLQPVRHAGRSSGCCTASAAPRWGKPSSSDGLDLIRQLEEIAACKQFEFETVCHERVVIQVDKTRKYRQATAGTIPLRPQAIYGLEGLAAGIELQPRKLTVEFAGAEDLLAKLYEFSQTIANDFERFRKQWKAIQAREFLEVPTPL